MTDIFSKYEPSEYENVIEQPTIVNGTIFSSKKFQSFKPSSPEPDYEFNNTGLGLKLTPKGRLQMIYGLKKPTLINIYNPETAPIGEYENRYLVYMLRALSNYVNNQVIWFFIIFY